MPRRRSAPRSRTITRLGTREMTVNGENFRYELERSARRTVGLYVHPGGQIRIRMPLSMREDALQSIIRDRAAWLSARRARMATVPERTGSAFTPGSTLPFLGVSLALECVAGSGRPPVRTPHNTLRVTVPDPARRDRVQAHVARWYREQAQLLFVERTHAVRRDPFIAALGTPASVTTRLMTRRWGSCFADGRIVLNTELIGASVELIDAVIVHELCHLTEHNHSARFWALLDRAMPAWRERHAELSRTVPSGFLRLATDLPS